MLIYRGVVTLDELLEAGDKIKAHADYNEHFNGVCDFRNAQKKVDPKKVEQLTYRHTRKSPPLGKWCSINATPKETGISFLLQEKRFVQGKMEVFTTVSAASEYVMVDLLKYLDKD